MSTVDAINLQAFPWRELAKKKMNEAQARLVKEGGSGDMKEQERLESIQRRENWDRTRALLNNVRQDTNQPLILSFAPPTTPTPQLHPALPAALMTLDQAILFDLESEAGTTGPTGAIVVEMGQAIE